MPNARIKTATVPSKIERISLHIELADALRTMILEGAFLNEERIPERELCVRFGVSRTPLREALKVLASEGLIQLEHNRGARLREISLKEVRDLYEVLGSYEVTVGRLAVERATERDLAVAQAIHGRLRNAFQREDRTEYFQYNQEIHAALVAMTKNDALIEAHRQCYTKIAVVRYRVNYNRRRWSESMAEHELIIEAAARRSADLPRLLHLHAEATAQATIEHIQQMQTGAKARGEVA